MTEKSEWEKYQEKTRDVKPWDFLNPNTEYASDELAVSRYDTCLSCPELIKLTKTCKQCGCFMALKTKLQDATCPLNKW
jgi:hypothetical protein